MRHTGWGSPFFFHVSPFAVAAGILRHISEYILTLEFEGDLGTDLVELVYRIRKNRTASSEFGEFLKQCTAGSRGLLVRRVNRADGIELNVGFLEHFFDIFQ